MVDVTLDEFERWNQFHSVRVQEFAFVNHPGFAFKVGPDVSQFVGKI